MPQPKPERILFARVKKGINKIRFTGSTHKLFMKTHGRYYNVGQDDVRASVPSVHESAFLVMFPKL